MVRYVPASLAAWRSLMRHFLPRRRARQRRCRAAWQDAPRRRALIARAGATQTTRAGECARTPRRSRSGRGRSRRQMPHLHPAALAVVEPDSSARCSGPNAPPQALDSAGQGGHKGPAHTPFPGAAHRGPGGSDANQNPGPSSLICRREHIADLAARLDAAQSTTRSSAADGGRPCYSDVRNESR